MARIRWVLFAMFLVVIGCGKAEAPRNGAPPRTETGKEMRKALLEVSVDLSMDIASPEEASKVAQAAIDRTNALGGFVQNSSIDSSGSILVLRVPTANVDDVRSVLAGHGPIAHESRAARDVTDAVMDLDARVKSAKVEETRLLELLQNKTGNLADVLAVEKALADVRDRIERLETEQKAAHGRVELAVMTVRLHVRGAFDGAPIGQQLIIAGREGVAALKTATVLVATTTLRAGPTLLMFAAMAYGAVRAINAMRARRRQQSAS
jgi:hypothetical protein